MKPSTLAPVLSTLPCSPSVQPMDHYQPSLPGSGPLRTDLRPGYPSNRNLGVPMCQHNCTSPPSVQSLVPYCHVPPTHSQVRCQPNVGNGYLPTRPRPEEMPPPLIYDPLPKARPSCSNGNQPRLGKNFGVNSFSNFAF